MTHPIRGERSPKITVEITAENIAQAIPRDSGHCMIADAIAAAVPKAAFISVDLATVRFTDLAAGRRYVYLTPRSAQVALIRFDNGEPVEPFRMRLEHAHVLPTGSARQARAQLRTSDKGNKAGNVPTRVGGESPPLGPLVAGAPRTRQAGKLNGAGAGNARGRRREYGLRALIR